MSRLEVSIPGEQSYDVLIGQGVLSSLGSELRNLGLSTNHVLIITDSEVSGRYLPQAKYSLEQASFQVDVITIPSGEEAKSLACISEVWQAMADCGLTRDSVVIALGGGVVGDLAGFSASTFMRGVPFVQVPTTLLSMVDSSVGGKTAVNLPSGKNLVGSFYQPLFVCADVALLPSLPDREWLCGCGEIAKTAVIDSLDFFNWLSNHADEMKARIPVVVEEAIERCIRFKSSVVIADKHETSGIRECLNYGHTLAHAIETYAGYGVYSHGHAVAQGMRFAARLSAGLGKTDLDFVLQQDELLNQLGFPEISLDASVEELMKIMKHDKKVRLGNLRFVVPCAIGSWEVLEISDEVVSQYVSAWLASNRS